jgi:DNA-binding NtrC family response regulator
MASHRILYAGDDVTLPARLGDALHGLDCFVVRSPVDSARTLIRSEIKYSLLLFDETEAGAGLEAYARTLEHRERTPVIMVKKSEGLSGLLGAIKRELVTGNARA